MVATDSPVRPGRIGEVDGFVATNDRFGTNAAITPSAWGVRFGTAQYPDYAHPFYGGGFTGGHMLTPDDAEELAAHLVRVAAWARAQNSLEGRGA